MIISNSKGFIYLHIPKAGGTSVTTLLDPELEWNDIVLGGTPAGELMQEIWSPRFGLYKHSLPECVRAVMGDCKYEGYKKIVVVRDPIERVFSAYRYFKTLSSTKEKWFVEAEESKRIGNLVDFRGFVCGEYFRESFMVEPRETHDFQRCFLPQSYYFDKREYEEGRFFWFRLEELANSLDVMALHGFVRKGAALGHENRSGDIDIDVNPDLIAELRELYREDYKIFALE